MVTCFFSLLRVSGKSTYEDFLKKNQSDQIPANLLIKY